MENLSGSWTGDLNGTNQGKMLVKLSHEGDRIYGEGYFNEPTMGTYQYQIQGIVAGEKVNLILTPGQRSHNLVLGNVEVIGALDENGKIQGSWHSAIGTKGFFSISRAEQEKKLTEESSEGKRDSVFIVHGHDDATKEKVARFVEKLGIEAIILHEKVNSGMTIIEKFEKHAKEVGFAIVLFTPDDVAYPLGDEGQKRPRARQNVILEMGYFVGALGREKVCVLYKGDVELPSDILGVVYTKIGEDEAWKISLAKELKMVGYKVDLNKLL